MQEFHQLDMDLDGSKLCLCEFLYIKVVIEFQPARLGVFMGAYFKPSDGTYVAQSCSLRIRLSVTSG